MKFTASLFLLFFTSLSLISQSIERDTFYFNQNWELTTKEKATSLRLCSISNYKYDGNFEDIKLSDKIIMTKGSYKNGRLHGPYSEFYSDGTILLKGKFDRGKQTGIWIYYYPDGYPRIKMTYQVNKIKVNEYYDKDSTQQIENGDGEINLNFTIGDTPTHLKATFKNGVSHGKWIYKNSRNNSKLVTEKYRRGEFIHGLNHETKHTSYYPLVKLNNLFYSKRYPIINKYVLANNTSSDNYRQIKEFSVKFTKNLYILNKQSLKNFPEGSVYDIEVGPNGAIWFYVMQKGLFRIKDGQLKQYIEDFRYTYHKNTLHIDKDGEVWFAVNNINRYEKSGLTHIVNDSIEFINVNNSGLTCNYIKSITSHNDSIILGTCNSINIYNKETDDWSFLFNPRIHTRKLDTSKILYHKQVEKYDGKDDSEDNEFRCLLYSSGKIWAGTLDGLECYTNDRIILYNKTNNSFFKANYVSEIEPFENGLMVFFDESTEYGGITIYNNNKWEHIDNKDRRFLINKVERTTNYKKQEIWLQGALGDIIKINNDKIFNYFPRKTLNDFHIHDMTTDEKGNLYFATNKGILIKTREKE